MEMLENATKERKAPGAIEVHVEAYKVDKTQQKYHLGVFP
jgi:hypothetical protein